MIDILNQLNDIGWFNVVITLALVIILIPLAIDSWKKFKLSIGLKSVNEIEEQEIQSSLQKMTSELEKLSEEVKQYGNNRINDREKSFKKEKEIYDTIERVTDAINVTIEEMAVTLNEMKQDALDEKIERIRWRILDFAGDLRNGKITDIEQFYYIFKTCDKYEDLIKANNLKNGQVTEAIKFIHEKYHELLFDNN